MWSVQLSVHAYMEMRTFKHEPFFLLGASGGIFLVLYGMDIHTCALTHMHMYGRRDKGQVGEIRVRWGR